MPLPQDAFDQLRLERRRIFNDGRQVVHLQRFDHLVLDVVLPFHEVRQADVPVDDVLHPVPALEAWQPAQPRGVPVLRVHLHPVRRQEVIQERHPFPVFLMVLNWLLKK